MYRFHPDEAKPKDYQLLSVRSWASGVTRKKHILHIQGKWVSEKGQFTY